MLSVRSLCCDCRCKLNRLDRAVTYIIRPRDVRLHLFRLPTSDCLSSLMAGELGLSAKDHAPRLCPLAALPQHQTTMRRRGIGPNISKRFEACLLQDAVRTCAERLEPPALGFFTLAVNAAPKGRSIPCRPMRSASGMLCSRQWTLKPFSSRLHRNTSDTKKTSRSMHIQPQLRSALAMKSTSVKCIENRIMRATASA
jgi:hypothetical protein